ncbi:hypothetical protein K504DRAFT_486259 [Pleomassaria siparia CBS 279.74]|uniref:Uncharacterized protein n=1 Tax=Pleomassaria siparia CBS 279.74 TaxID=1314801 RepID=A0A6G1KNU8_9PLEO|nr:hypothetical protein K504DRAFT_486259 [Pleomassaria siparia CBS 279.74]
MASVGTSSSVATQDHALGELDDSLPDPDAAQFIPGSNIDPSKLMLFLRTKFGAGTYDTHILQNSYCIIAPAKLSIVRSAHFSKGRFTNRCQGEIARCRRR